MFLLHAFLLQYRESILPSLITYEHPKGIIHALWETWNPKGRIFFTYFHRSCSLSFSPVLCGENDIYYTCQHFVSVALILSSQACCTNLSLVVLLILTFSAFSSFIQIFIFPDSLWPSHPHPISITIFFHYLTDSVCFTVLSCSAAWFRVGTLHPGCTFTLYISFSLAECLMNWWLFTKAVPAGICKYKHSCSSQYLSRFISLVNTIGVKLWGQWAVSPNKATPYTWWQWGNSGRCSGWLAEASMTSTREHVSPTNQTDAWVCLGFYQRLYLKCKIQHFNIAYLTKITHHFHKQRYS